MSECNQEVFSFAAHFSRRVEASFTAGQVSSDGGALLLRQADGKIDLLSRVTACFTDRRSPLPVTHKLAEMLSQRIYGLVLGYEDINDHEQLRHDPLMAVLAGRRKLEYPLAGKSTPNRLELAGGCKRYHKIDYSAEKIDALLCDLFIESQAREPDEKPAKRRACLPSSSTRPARVGRGRAASSPRPRFWIRVKIHASPSPRWAPASGPRVRYTSSSTASAARWRTA